MLYGILQESLARVQLKDNDMKILFGSLKASVKWRFDYVINEKSNVHSLFLAATFLDFRFKKFSFILNHDQRKASIKKAKVFLKDFYKCHFEAHHSIGSENSATQGNINATLTNSNIAASAPPTVQEKIINNKVNL